MRLFRSISGAVAHLNRRRQLFRAAFASKEGRPVLLDLARFCGAFDTSYSPSDSHETAFREGMRNVWLYIVRQLEMTDAEVIELARTMTEEDDQ
jgi:hypothetical protein